MKKIVVLLGGISLVFASSCNSSRKALNTLSKAELAENWILLFNGSNSDGWRGVNKEHFPANWEVSDGTLHCEAYDKIDAEIVDGGDILYTGKQFENFHLKLEWKVEAGGNSGIFYLGQEVDGWKSWMTAPEMQLLDDANHPDALKGEHGNRTAGSLYDLIPALPQNVKPAGTWNTAEIICQNGSVKHIQNGMIVVEYELWTQEWKDLVSKSKYPSYNKRWGNVAKEGYIALQDHRDNVWFRNIKIKEIY